MRTGTWVFIHWCLDGKVSGSTIWTWKIPLTNGLWLIIVMLSHTQERAGDERYNMWCFL